MKAFTVWPTQLILLLFAASPVHLAVCRSIPGGVAEDKSSSRWTGSFPACTGLHRGSLPWCAPAGIAPHCPPDSSLSLLVREKKNTTSTSEGYAGISEILWLGVQFCMVANNLGVLAISVASTPPITCSGSSSGPHRWPDEELDPGCCDCMWV